jgi:hypothetical protein
MKINQPTNQPSNTVCHINKYTYKTYATEVSTDLKFVTTNIVTATYIFGLTSDGLIDWLIDNDGETMSQNCGH